MRTISYPFVPPYGTEGPFPDSGARGTVVLEQHLGEG